MIKKISIIILFITVTMIFACASGQKQTIYNKDSYSKTNTTSDTINRDYDKISREKAINKLKEYDAGNVKVITESKKKDTYTAHIKIGDRVIDYTYKVKDYLPSFKEIVILLAICTVIVLVLLEQLKTTIPEAIKNIIKSFKKK